MKCNIYGEHKTFDDWKFRSPHLKQENENFPLKEEKEVRELNADYEYIKYYCCSVFIVTSMFYVKDYFLSGSLR